MPPVTPSAPLDSQQHALREALKNVERATWQVAAGHLREAEHSTHRAAQALRELLQSQRG